jgi:hypothetical protein
MTLQGTAFTVAETHGRAMRPENELLAHGQDVGWRSLHAAIFKEAPLHVTEPALDHPFIIYHITHPTIDVALSWDFRHKATCRAGCSRTPESPRPSIAGAG